MLITQIVLFAIGLFVSSLAKNYKAASLFTMLVVMIFYALNFTLDYAGTMNYLNFLTPVRYFEVTGITQTGLDAWYVLLSAAITAGCCFAASGRYGNKDLRG